jgi:hypothetical protein
VRGTGKVAPTGPMLSAGLGTSVHCIQQHRSDEAMVSGRDCSLVHQVHCRWVANQFPCSSTVAKPSKAA